MSPHSLSFKYTQRVSNHTRVPLPPATATAGWWYISWELPPPPPRGIADTVFNRGLVRWVVVAVTCPWERVRCIWVPYTPGRTSECCDRVNRGKLWSISLYGGGGEDGGLSGKSIFSMLVAEGVFACKSDRTELSECNLARRPPPVLPNEDLLRTDADRLSWSPDGGLCRGTSSRGGGTWEGCSLMGLPPFGRGDTSWGTSSIAGEEIGEERDERRDEERRDKSTH